MAQRLPVPGSDDNSWGDILNGFLGVVHNSDGTLKTGLITTNEISSSAGITKTQLSSAVQTTLTNADNAMHLTGAETVAGVKTFSSSPVVPTPAATDNTTNVATTAFVRNYANLIFPDFPTMISNVGAYPTGTVASVGRYVYQSSPFIEHNHSIWFRNYTNQWQPAHGNAIGVYSASGSASDSAAVLNSILTIANNNSSAIYIPTGTLGIENNGGYMFKSINYSAGFRLLATSDMRASFQLNGSQTIPGATLTALRWDTVLADPTGQFAVNNWGNGYISLPWTGRYQLSGHYSISTSAIPSGVYLGVSLYTSNGYSINDSGEAAGSGGFADVGHDFITEANLTAGDNVRMMIYMSDNNSRGVSYGDDPHRAKFHLRFLGGN